MDGFGWLLQTGEQGQISYGAMSAVHDIQKNILMNEDKYIIPWCIMETYTSVCQCALKCKENTRTFVMFTNTTKKLL